MTVCIDCGKKINRYFSNCEPYKDGFACEECYNRRKAEDKTKKDFRNMTQEEFQKIDKKTLTEISCKIYEQEEKYRQSSEYEEIEKQKSEKAIKDLLAEKVNAEIENISKICRRIIFPILLVALIIIGNLLFTPEHKIGNPYDTDAARFWFYAFWGVAVYGLSKILGELIALPERNKIKEKIMMEKKKCPQCGEEITILSLLCKSCGFKFNNKDTDPLV